MRVVATARIKPFRHAVAARKAAVPPVSPLALHYFNSRQLARVEHDHRPVLDVFDRDSHGLSVSVNGKGDGGPPDERTLKLGKTVRVLHERLPTLLASPLPQDILSPQISLHLFPSTHPHLPTVSGRIPYTGALWTAPVAWGRLPVVGNVKLDIVSERMVRNGGSTVSHDCRDEKLLVKWKTCSKTDGKTGTLYRGIGATEQLQKLTSFLGGESANEVFCGLFIFEFDSEGRIFKHTIEHAEEGGNYERMTKVVSVTDWLLGKAPWRKRDDVVPGLAFCHPSRGKHADLSRRRSDHDR